jgi:NAD(P) transhydrogenase
LNLEAAGIVLNERGFIPVDKSYRVIHPDTREPVPGIFACGDVIGAPSLASTSMEQARYAMIQAFNLEPFKTQVAPILPLGIYTIPECSGAGETERDCRRKDIPYVVGRASYGQNPRGMIMGDFDGFLKLIFDAGGDPREPMRLMGVHVIGEIASEIIHIGLTALMMGATSELFINTCFNYPTLGELYKYATYDALARRAQHPGTKCSFQPA